MQDSPLFILFNMVINFASVIILLRLLFDFAAIEVRHPYTRSVTRLSRVVDVFTPIFPPLAKGRISTASIVLLLLLGLIRDAGNAHLLKDEISAIGLFFGSVYGSVLIFLRVLRWVILGSVIGSWIVLFSGKIHPAVEIITLLAEPIIEPFRKITPNFGMLDLSALVALLALSLLSTVLGIVGQDIMRAIT